MSLSYTDYINNLLLRYENVSTILVRLSKNAEWLIDLLHESECNAMITTVCDRISDGESIREPHDAYVYFVGNEVEDKLDVSSFLEFRKRLNDTYRYSDYINSNKWMIAYLPQRNDFSNCAFLQLQEKNYKFLERKCIPLFVKLYSGNYVSIKGGNTNISFGYNNANVFSCFGQHNWPDGEIGVIPDRKTVNGSVFFRRIDYHGFSFKDVQLIFRDGKCINVICERSADFKCLLFFDNLSCYIGEFAFGLNPFIFEKKGMALVDEKIIGSFHLALGATDEVSGAQSFLHLDMISDSIDSFEIGINNEIIFTNGQFVGKTLQSISREKLMRSTI